MSTHMKWLARTTPKSCELVYGWMESISGALVTKGEAYHVALGPNAERVIAELVARYGDKTPSQLKLTPCSAYKASKSRRDDGPLLISAQDYQRALEGAPSPARKHTSLP